ncbi:hypothetical protein SAMN04488583_0893 [Mycobacterium sp. 88mf]|nr:hypothetical protein SAMN04488583_0893 [Mycobacterium sp. 88mf]SFF13615.1 hypothetical protein SAMN04488582_101467 [Mycobacterium sp. 455mf]
MTTPLQLHRLSTPRAAAFAGVLFALLFGAAIVLIWYAVPTGDMPGSQWAVEGNTRIRVASTLMPFAGIAFLWFIGVVRDGFGQLEDKFFSSVFLGSGLLFLAMVFGSMSVGMALAHSSTHVSDQSARSEVVAFGTMLLIALSKTYAIRMGAVFMISLATIWLKTGLMPRWLVWSTYVMAVLLLVTADMSVWLALVFPIWVFLVSLMLLARAGLIDMPGDGRERVV